MLLPFIVEKPTTQAVTLEEAKKHLDVYGFNDDDGQITSIVASATEHLEKTLNITLCKTKFSQSFANFCQAATPTAYPITIVESITYTDKDGNVKTLEDSQYRLLHTVNGSFICFENDLPIVARRPDAVKVVYYAGYDADSIPPSLKAAILLHCGSLYEYREDLSAAKPISTDAYNSLIWPFRRPKV